MLSKKMQKALNEQLTKEFASSYLYLQMAGWFEHKGFPGFAAWMKVQAQEEAAHTMVLFNYVCDRNGQVELGAIEPSETDFKSPLDVFQRTLTHEQAVTAWIHDLVELATTEKDHATRNRLDWFVHEQVEEEARVQDLVCRMKLAAENSAALFLLDKELGSRTFRVPAVLSRG
ncbi:MAG: ferritin [Candidatus Riflebacteria bacterium]|nr:ferritin [Candidatus Riflebacteria bacterium]